MVSCNDRSMTNDASSKPSRWIAAPIMAGFVFLAFSPVLYHIGRREFRRWQAAAAALQLRKAMAEDEPSVSAVNESLADLQRIYAADESDFAIGELLARTFSSVGLHKESIAIYSHMLAKIQDKHHSDENEGDENEEDEESPRKIDPADMPNAWRRMMLLRGYEYHRNGEFEKMAAMLNYEIAPCEKLVESIGEKSQFEFSNAARAAAYRRLAQLYNDRAYHWALQGIELDKALEDIDKALQLADRANQLNKKEPQPGELTINSIGHYLDTRGYILYRRSEEGDLIDALESLNQAIEMLEEDNMPWEEFFYKFRSHVATPQELEARYMASRSPYAVLYYHRGLIHQSLGDEASAQADFDHVRELGYTPDESLY